MKTREHENIKALIGVGLFAHILTAFMFLCFNIFMQKGIYRHYKGNLYEVIGVAHHSETLEEVVVYKTLYDAPEFGRGSLWVRPKKMFEEMVEWEGKTVARFTFVSS